MIDDLCVLLGGIEAERLLLDDISTGAASGVKSTPTFFLNGRRLQHSDLDDLLETAQCELNAKVGPKLILVRGVA